MSRMRVLSLSLVCGAAVAACSSSPLPDMASGDRRGADPARDPAAIVADDVLPDPEPEAATGARSFAREIDAVFDRPSGTVLIRAGSRVAGVERRREFELSWNRGTGSAVLRDAAGETAEASGIAGALLEGMRQEVRAAVVLMLEGVPMEERAPGSWQGFPPGTGGLMVVDLTLVDGMVAEIQRRVVGGRATAFDAMYLLD